MDQDGDGAINFSEMLTIMIRMHKKSRESQNLQKVFEVMDKDGWFNTLFLFRVFERLSMFLILIQAKKKDIL